MSDEKLQKQSLEVNPPSCLDCVSCSADCEIAVATGDSVQLYIPKPHISNYKDEFEEHQWYKPKFVTNIFTRNEFPPVEPLSINAFSIGEEQSNGKVTALKWSPPGLAINGRCALAVLTSNHLLSIWAPGSNHDEDHGWERVLVVNRSLNKYSATAKKVPPLCNNFSKKEQRALRSRVRAFSWAGDSMPTLLGKDHLLPINEINGVFFIAVTNDARELILVRINSPNILDRFEASWTAEVVNVISLPASADGFVSEIAFVDRLIEPSRYIDHVSWSPWFKDDQEARTLCHSKLAYIWNKHLFVVKCVLVLLQSDDIGIELEDEQENFPGEHQGILRWSISKNADMRAHLCSVLRDKMQRIDFPMNGSQHEPTIISSGRMDSTWCRYSGATVCLDTNSTESLHLALHSTVKSTPGYTFQWTADSNTAMVQPHWRSIVEQHKNVFDEQNGLNGAVLTRVVGLHSFPGTNYLIVCFTFHPSHAMEYAIASLSRATVLVRAQDVEDLDLLRLHNYSLIEALGDLKVEACVFLIKRWLRYKRFKGEDKSMWREKLVNSLLSLVEDTSNTLKPVDDFATVSRFVNYLRQRFNPTSFFVMLVLDAVDCLEDVKNDPRLANLLQNRSTIALKLSQEILLMPSNLYQGTEKDQQILELCRQLNANVHEKHAEAEPVQPLERCIICNEAILIESFAWARCSSNHRYPRCGLTFQSIQIPGQSRSCSFCDVPYLKQGSSVIGLESAPESGASQGQNSQPNGDQTAAEQQPSLSEILNYAINVCIYCGGKFKG